MPDAAFIGAVQGLSALGPLRVWSVLVTVFGDLAPDGPLDGPTLSAIMASVGAKPEATRVALHRLRSDGWITSQKQGRTSLHRLTATGQRDSAAARPRIYGTHAHPQDAALFLTADTDIALTPTQFAQIAPRLFIAAGDTQTPAGAMRLAPPALLPDWLGPQIETDSLRNGYAALYQTLIRIDTALPDGHRLTPLDIGVLRVMIVHMWRRLALKHPDLPRAAHSPEWRGHDCRALVARLLDRFPRPAPDQIAAR